MSVPRHAEVVGGGLAGLTAAAALAQTGWTVRVHETSSELRMFGAGIWLWENGLRVLDRIGVTEDTLARSLNDRLSVWEIRDERNRLLIQRPFSETDRLYIPPRATLYEALLKATREAGVEIVTSSTAVSATPDGVLTLENGREHKAGLIVAADGWRSHIRESLGLTARLSLKRDCATRLLVPRHEFDLRDLSTEYWNRNRRVLVCPSSDDVGYLSLAHRIDDERGRRVPVDKASWLASFPILEHMIERIGEAGRWDRFCDVRCRAWSAGKVAIIGDAAHAQPPNLGQGANLSFANALGLAVAVENASDIPAALRQWEARERPLTDHTQRWTNIYGTLIDSWPAGLAAVRSLLVRWTARSAWLGERLNRAANATPTGTEMLFSTR